MSQTLEIDNPEQVGDSETQTLGRGTRKRKKTDDGCHCGEPVSTSDKEEQKAVMCTFKGCEALWVSLFVVHFNFAHFRRMATS